MDALTRRKEEDIKKIRDMDHEHPGMVEFLGANQHLTMIKVRINVPTARDREYPMVVQQSTDVEIELPAKYPFEMPHAKVLTPIWNPNVFIHGNICMGGRWLPTENLDLYVKRIIRIFAFDPLIINTASAAHSEASLWYLAAKDRHPRAFPSIALEKLYKSPKPPEKIVFKEAKVKGSLSDFKPRQE